jgi:two-component system, NarL family, response regulator LiaR
MTESPPIRVLIVDDHMVVRGGLATFLKAFKDMQLVGEAENGEQAIRRCQEEQPDVVVMDLKMPVMDGVTATRIIRERFPRIRIIALTSYTEDELVQRALEAGAAGYLLKNISHIQLAEAIRAAHHGRSTLAPEATEALIRAVAHATTTPGHDLTPREREVLALMIKGLSNAQIAARLIISEATAKTHVSHIMGKLGAGSRTHAVALALEHRLT